MPFTPGARPPHNPLDGYAQPIEMGINSAIQELSNINLSSFDLVAGIALIPASIHEDTTIAPISSRIMATKVGITTNVRMLRASLTPASAAAGELVDVIAAQTNSVVGSISSIISLVDVARDYTKEVGFEDWDKWELSNVMHKATESLRTVTPGHLQSIQNSVSVVNSSIVSAAAVVESAQPYFDSVMINASSGPDSLHYVRSSLLHIETLLSTISNRIQTARDDAASIRNNILWVINTIIEDLDIVLEMNDIAKLSTLSIVYSSLPDDVKSIIDGMMT